MVGGLNGEPVLASTRIIADFDGGFGIYGKTQDGFVGVRRWIDLAQSLENGVGLRNLFFGRLFCTVLGW